MRALLLFASQRRPHRLLVIRNPFFPRPLNIGPFFLIRACSAPLFFSSFGRDHKGVFCPSIHDLFFFLSFQARLFPFSFPIALRAPGPRLADTTLPPKRYFLPPDGLSLFSSRRDSPAPFFLVDTDESHFRAFPWTLSKEDLLSLPPFDSSLADSGRCGVFSLSTANRFQFPRDPPLSSP